MDNSLPRSAVCFFTIKLPKYDSKELFTSKMKYEIENCSDISDQ